MSDQNPNVELNKDATSYALGSEFKLRSEDTVYVTAAPVTRWNRG